jgi:hypothetical protein
LDHLLFPKIELDPHIWPLQPQAELLSLGLTIPTIMLGILVVYLWRSDSIEAFNNRSKHYSDWLILGVAISFIGTVLDNAYWYIPWTASYFGSPYTIPLVNFGVFVNIFCRQTLDILAGICHIKAWVECQKTEEKETLLKRMLIGSFALGAVSMIGLYFFKLYLLIPPQ